MPEEGTEVEGAGLGGEVARGSDFMADGNVEEPLMVEVRLAAEACLRVGEAS